MATQQNLASRAAHETQRCGLTPPPAGCPLDAARARHMPEKTSRHLRDPTSRGMAPPQPPFFAYAGGFGGGALGSGHWTHVVTGEEIRQEPQERTEVTVKNTFIHVEDVAARSVQRSLSESDLSSGSGSFWSHNDTTGNSNASSGTGAPDMRSPQARSNAKPGGSKVADSRAANMVAKSAIQFASTGPPPSTSSRSTQKGSGLAPGGFSSAEASGVQSVQSHARVAPPNDAEGQDDPPEIAFEEEDLGDVPNEAGDPHPGEPIQWSVGSEEHAAGNCRPCMYIRSSAGCKNGRSCVFCHVPHKSKSRGRPCKAKRLLCKQMVERYDSLRAENSQMADALRMEMDAQVASSAPERAYMLKVMAVKENCRERSGQSTSSTTRQQDAWHRSDLLWKMTL